MSEYVLLAAALTFAVPYGYLMVAILLRRPRQLATYICSVRILAFDCRSVKDYNDGWCSRIIQVILNAAASGKRCGAPESPAACVQIDGIRWRPGVRRRPPTRTKTEIGTMASMDRITFDPAVMGGKPCIRGQRVTVAMVLGLLAAGRTRDEILNAYPYLEAKDIDQCLAYAAWRMEERDVPLTTA